MRRFLLLMSACLPAFAQLVSPAAIPKGPNPPVVFLDGYQTACPGSFKGTFGNADTVLQASGIASVFFDNCAVTASGRPSIEQMAGAFATFLLQLRFTDGTPVNQADIVAHSMGGLIVRSFLAGMRTPAPVPSQQSQLLLPNFLRKGVFLATPHFGTAVASTFGDDIQTQEMSLGSQFLLSLATWKGGLDDLGGLDAIAVAGNAGGLESGILNFDDAVVSLNSASLGFARPGRTRVLPVCHTNLGFLCPGPTIANINDASNQVGQIITSFLTGTAAWQSIGRAVESVAPAATNGGLLLGFQDANGAPLAATSGIANAGSGTVNLGVGPVALFKEALAAGSNLAIQAKVGANTANLTVPNLAAASSTAIISRPGPAIRGVVPAGSAVFPYDVTFGAYVTIYGSGFVTAAATALPPYPPTLAGVTVNVNGQPAALQYVGPGQINLIFPFVTFTTPPFGQTPLFGPATISVTTPTGTATTTTMVVAAVPSIFSLDHSGTGPAAAINAATSAIVGPTARLKAGVDYVELFLTGLGPTTTAADGLDHANAVVTLTIGGGNCPVTYAGRVPGFAGLDQVNCQIPAGLSGAAVPVIVTAAGRLSNTVTLAIE